MVELVRDIEVHHRMAKILRNPEEFLREWRAGAWSMPPRDARILADVALRGKTLAQVGKQYNLSRERVRQITDRSVRVLRNAARRNPESELGRAAQAIEELKESAAIETWKVRRMAQRGKDEVARMLVRLDVIAEDQRRLAPVLCFLAERPRKRRVSLEGMAQDVRNILLVNPSGVSPEDMRRRLKGWHEPMRTWPRLDLGTFVAARLDIVTTQDGKMRLADTGDSAMLRRTIAQRFELALRQAGRCLHRQELTEWVRRAEAEEGDHAPQSVPINARTALWVLNQDRRFQWVGRGTYGLTEWGMGLSVPHQALGKRPAVSMEIEYVLRGRDSIPVSELVEHINRRLRVKAATIRVRARRMPGTEILDNTLYRVGSDDHRRAKGQMGPSSFN